MRKNKPGDEPTPAGGRALVRAQQFNLSRGLPEPVTTPAPTAKKPAGAKKTAKPKP
jgi:hypothetical protein